MTTANRRRIAQRNRLWCATSVRAFPWLLLLLVVAGQLAAADQALPIPLNLGPSVARAKISSLIRPYLDLAPAAQGLDRKLRGMMVAASRPDLLKVRLDVAVTPANLATIAGTGALLISSSPQWNCVLVEATMAQIDALAQLPEVVRIAAALRPRHHGVVGSYSSQADAVLHTDIVKSTYGVTGAGQIIGVISDSVNLTPATGATSTHGGGSVTGSNPGTLTGTIPQANGNLPSALAVFNLDLPNIGADTDEGEALLEVAYHMAPGASYAFSSAGNGDTDFATSIQQLQGFGCTLICDDIGFPDEPMFQDGPVAQAATAFVAGGGIFCSAAGNAANTGILTTYVSATGLSDPHNNQLPNGNTFTSWGIGGGTPGYLPLVLGPHTSLTITLEWNQTYHSFGLGAGPATDLDLYLYSTTNANANNILTASTDSQQVGSGDPFEYLQYTNPFGSNLTVYLAVDLFAGPSTNLVMRLLLDAEGGSVTCPDPGILVATTIQGHPAASAVLAIAAVDWSTPTQVESFTSFGGQGAGGIPYYFDTAGIALAGAPVQHAKPDLTATDGLFVSDADFVFPGPNSPPVPQGFYGTSCATPAATAAAALAWCVQPGLTNQQIIAELTASATDITASPASAGFDGWSGNGLVNASAAIGATITGVTRITSTPSSGILSSGTISIKVTFTSAVTVTAGTPVLQLNTSPPRSATYASGSGTNTLTFTYTIVAGDTSANLDCASISALSGGTITAALPLSVGLPKPGAPGSLGANSSLTIASVPDALTVVATPATSNATAFTFIFTFVQPVTGFTSSMITVTNGTKGTFSPGSGSGTTFTLAVTADAVAANSTETVTASVAAGVVSDGAGNHSLAGSGSALVDTVPPTLAITLAANVVTTGQNDTATFTFSKPMANFFSLSIDVSGGALGALSGSGAVYTAPVTAGAVGTMTVTVNAGGGLHDVAGNDLATPGSAQATVVPAPPGSSKHCGFGNFFGLLVLGGLFWLRRGQAGPARR